MPAPALLRLTRPGNALVAAAAVWVGSFLARHPMLPDRPVLLGMLAAVAFAAAGNVRNDLSDVEVDKRAHPDRPLAAGEVSPRAARFLAFVLYAVALECAALVSLAALVLVAAAIPVMEGYERALKRRGLPGNLAIGLLTAAPFVLGGVVAARGVLGWGALDAAALVWHPALLSVALLAALATAGREVLKDIEDEASDRGHRETLPMRIGARGAALVAGAFLVAAALLSPLPWRLESVIAWTYLPAVGLADACFLAAAVAGTRRPPLAQRLAKLGMVVALAALAIGRATWSDGP